MSCSVSTPGSRYLCSRATPGTAHCPLHFAQFGMAAILLISRFMGLDPFHLPNTQDQTKPSNFSSKSCVLEKPEKRSAEGFSGLSAPIECGVPDSHNAVSLIQSHEL